MANREVAAFQKFDEDGKFDALARPQKVPCSSGATHARECLRRAPNRGSYADAEYARKRLRAGRAGAPARTQACLRF
jgi:hypothetical protein